MRLVTRLPELDVVRCEGCGAGLTPTALGATIRCHHCNAEQPLPGAVRTRLEQFRQAVAEQVPRIVAALEDADLFRYEHGTETGITYAAVVGGCLFLLLFCGAPASCFVVDNPKTRDAIGIAVFAVPLLMLAVIAVIRVFRNTTRKKVEHDVVVPDVPARCSACGGDNVMRDGELVANCSYCRVPMVPSPQAIEEVVARVRKMRLDALRHKFRTQRELRGPRGRLSMGGGTEPAALAKEEAEAHAAPAWAPYREAMRALAGRLGGEYVEGSEAIGWLDARFPGVDPTTTQPWGHPRGAVVIERDGYPVLLKTWEHMGRKRLGVLVATEETDGPGDGPPEERQRFASAGWEFGVAEAGLYAVGAEGHREAVEGNPSAVDAMVQAVDELVRAARALSLAPSPDASPSAAR